MSIFRRWALRRTRHPHTSSLCRRYSNAATEIAPQSRWNIRNVSTLTPSLLTPADYIDLSGKARAAVHFPTSETHDFFPYTSAGNIPFPKHSRGFLYYQSDAHAGPLEGSIRFRLTPDNSPASFPRGQDLRAPSGFPWQILLPQVACRDHYTFIGAQLVHEKLITLDQLSRCRAVFASRARMAPQHTVFRLDSPFYVNFAKHLTVTVVGDQLHDVNLGYLFWVREYSQKYFPWTGSAIARFERSTLREHAQRRAVSMRIVEILTPVTPTRDLQSARSRIIRPEEGQLFTVCPNGPLDPWAYEIDSNPTKTADALRVLWDNSSTP
ncbi:hypothetical protein B0H17DRAFT_295631 [Mycena rosella]|uniref:Uncharacterized protein n=1 Tax=Mycena rosella TaxID=1033263 RepID=A0AAD7CUX5_MYCRO|nr:hypothetical protein B0H17DRAFT_295631 [Mycena rosella]